MHIAIYNAVDPNDTQDITMYNSKKELINSILETGLSTLPDNVIVIEDNGKVIHEYKLYFEEE
jgi:hypothetical protein|tara:strand:- start:713 stop:901 length:189 start_codon:yes stop_codon:yes gene_type:complete